MNEKPFSVMSRFEISARQV
jgi:hypothetical protein